MIPHSRQAYTDTPD